MADQSATGRTNMRHDAIGSRLGHCLGIFRAGDIGERKDVPLACERNHFDLAFEAESDTSATLAPLVTHGRDGWIVDDAREPGRQELVQEQVKIEADRIPCLDPADHRDG